MGIEQLMAIEMKPGKGKFLTFITAEKDFGISMLPVTPILDLRSRLGRDSSCSDCNGIFLEDIPGSGKSL